MSLSGLHLFFGSLHLTRFSYNGTCVVAALTHLQHKRISRSKMGIPYVGMVSTADYLLSTHGNPSRLAQAFTLLSSRYSPARPLFATRFRSLALSPIATTPCHRPVAIVRPDFGSSRSPPQPLSGSLGLHSSRRHQQCLATLICIAPSSNPVLAYLQPFNDHSLNGIDATVSFASFAIRATPVAGTR